MPLFYSSSIQSLRTQQFGVSTNVYNTGVGYQAGYAITSGTDNTLLGGLAGTALTTGLRNVALGRSALASETTGLRSVAIGFSALNSLNLTDGSTSYNVGVGYSAGNQMTH